MEVSAGQYGKGLFHRLQIDLNIKFINLYYCALPQTKWVGLKF
jgi:hypothetical protein